MYHDYTELRELVKMHAVHQQSNEEPLSYDEVLIVKVRRVSWFTHRLGQRLCMYHWL